MSAASVLAPGVGGARRAPSGRTGRRVLPGFNLTLGYTLLYLSLIVLIPLSALVLKTFSLTWPQFWDAVTSPRVLASYRLTFGASLIAALVNVFFGLLLAWVLVRYSFPGKKIVDALVAKYGQPELVDVGAGYATGWIAASAFAAAALAWFLTRRS